MPPMYDERLSNDVLNKLQFAPLLFTIFGYWMVSSNQLISNEYLTPKTLSTDLYDPQQAPVCPAPLHHFRLLDGLQ